ncbi:type 1 glutamine amidotransferase domain-containing protein [Actinoallomurus rhizosphaericola]|uniref:type 1 glutamine amidotransferase domain-containing protein n=1 Tax=Actinoallomurus rhizosphaericola TaxID=2952536 RepID=UPI00209301D8|nr:type 1 glutamine amidotransferase domain-containing protein [Actinoallomurus rhizosphaericola]MCO6000150.1 type 1 glutamine amidotransferase domain-containing protein [Actinoallomurus rhizosphaericola]
MAKILFVMTGADHLTLADGTRHPTGYWAEEFVAPYRAFTETGYDVVVATPGGVVPTVDRASLAPEVNGGQEGSDAMIAALDAIAEVRKPIDIEEADVADYAAVFYPGGHGPMEDLASNADSARLLTAALEAGKPLGVVCHGVAALLATERSDGSSPFTGYRVTGFTRAEEVQTGLAEKAKWVLEDRLVALGVRFSAGEPWAPNVVVDRNVHTGQNPASSAPLAAELVKTLG